MTGTSTGKWAPKKKIESGSVKLGLRDKKIAREVEKTVAFLIKVSEFGLAGPSLEVIRERALGLAKIQIFLLKNIASASDVPKAIRKEARALTETTRQLAGRPPIYEVPPTIRREARRLALALDAATRRGTGSSNLAPGSAGRIVSLMDRRIKAGMSQRKAAESLSERFPASASRIAQIYRQAKARL